MLHFLCLPLFLSSLLDSFLLQAHRAIHSYSGVSWKYFHPRYDSVSFLISSLRYFYPSFPYFLYRTLLIFCLLILSLFPSPSSSPSLSFHLFPVHSLLLDLFFSPLFSFCLHLLIIFAASSFPMLLTVLAMSYQKKYV